MQIIIRHIEGCPHTATMVGRVEQALSELGAVGIPIGLELVGDPQRGLSPVFAGSPTLMVDGSDPFPSAATVAGPACRVYPTLHGPDGAPTVEQLREVLAR